MAPTPLSLHSRQEDAHLRDKYPVYADTASVYALLASEDILEKNGRSQDQIKKRVKQLGLSGVRWDGRTDDPTGRVHENPNRADQAIRSPTSEGRVDKSVDGVSPERDEPSRDERRERTPRPRVLRRQGGEQSSVPEDDSDDMFGYDQVRNVLFKTSG